MLLDNSDKGKNVYEWIEKFTEDGTFCAVTGYFTIGVLAYLSEKINNKISKFQMVLGDIASRSKPEFRPLNLLSEEFTADSAFKLSKCAKTAVDFLKQDKVLAKTLEPNFCHAKLYLHNSKKDAQRNNYFISGSSNLTEAGIGLKSTSNAELNIAETGDNNQYNELKIWFDNLWERALNDKTVEVNGRDKKVNFKEYLIAEISRIFEKYSPNDIYFKIICELLPDELSQEKVEKKLEDSEIYKKLFEFQKKSVWSIVRMLENQNGAILGDAVGLGKTFTALAVIKYYQELGRNTVVFAPKKLQYNWEQYKKTRESIFEKDEFDYEIRFHTDLNENRLSDILKYLTNKRSKLIVIDESHNLRNDKSNRYQFLKNEILRKNKDVKVLMLSATPINNSFKDIGNQFKLIGDFKNIDTLIKNAQDTLNEWAKNTTPVIGELLNKLHPQFRELTSSLVLAKTRKDVSDANIVFPKLETPLINIYKTPNCVESANTFDDLEKLLPERFSAYMAAYYAGLTSKHAIRDESRRSLFLVKMMHILLVKRLESSWLSFKKTLEKILKRHKETLASLENPDAVIYYYNEEEPDDDNDEPERDAKQTVKVNDLVNLGTFDAFKADLLEDINKMEYLLKQMENFTPDKDTKIKELIKLIKKKQKSGNNGNNQKVLIFTTYADTAEYIYEELAKHFCQNKIEIVTGDMGNQKIDGILKRFSPESKTGNKNVQDPIDILIATDVLSEGQNLQDCDYVVNYDIHWNPVRAIQRLGRIDRIGSKNKTIYCVNFWPAKNINEYLKLQERIEKRMSAMTVAGSEIPEEFTERLRKMNETNDTERKKIKKDIMALETNPEEIESKNFGLNNLSIETYREDLTKEVAEKYKNLPNGIFSGFKAKEKGLIALLEHKKNAEKKLVFINENGEEIISNLYETLQFLKNNKDAPRSVPQSIDNCDAREAETLSNAVKRWLENSIKTESENVENDFFNGLTPTGNINENTETVEQKLDYKNWNIICWEVISNES